ncbi:MAG TPA: hypothetical protein VGW58_00070 [Pyrinomonadaceae bacterium]|nr:hypothetical protein [Pyrinomonadaceae bacterium]
MEGTETITHRAQRQAFDAERRRRGGSITAVIAEGAAVRLQGRAPTVVRANNGGDRRRRGGSITAVSAEGAARR